MARRKKTNRTVSNVNVFEGMRKQAVEYQNKLNRFKSADGILGVYAGSGPMAVIVHDGTLTPQIVEEIERVGKGGKIVFKKEIA